MIDSSDIESYNTNGLIRYSGKYHNYCAKLTVELTPEYIPIRYSIDKGSVADSKILDNMLLHWDKLPYELFLDKGYEKYERRRELKKKNCQVRMEMKRSDKNRKRGPRFKFTQEQKKQRAEVEKIFSWLKSFLGLKLNRMRKKSLLTAKIIFCLSYYAFARLLKF